jgi:hypothetical protein
MTEFFERITQFAHEAMGKLSVRSALNPCLWLATLSFPFGLGLAAMSHSLLLEIAGLTLAFIPVVLFATGFLYFMIKSPDKLRSEDFEIRRTALSLIEQKGGNIAIAVTSVEAISNPDYPAQPKQLGQERDG